MYVNISYIECFGTHFGEPLFVPPGFLVGSQFGLDSVTVPDGILGLGWTGLGTLCSLADFCGFLGPGCSLGDIKKLWYLWYIRNILFIYIYIQKLGNIDALGIFF